MHRLRPRQGLSQARALDPEPPARGPAYLRIARLRESEGRAEQRLRPAPHQRNLGAQAISPALLAAALSSVLVGAGIAVSRLAVAEVQPLTLAMLRYAIGGACLLPFAWRAAGEFGKVQPLH